MIEKLLRYIVGYLKVMIIGDSIERFLNLANARNIHIWNVDKGETLTTFYIGIKDLYRLKTIIKKTKTKIRIQERIGVPFLLFSYRKRKMFFLGLATSWVIVYVMSLYVWNISFEGNYTHTDDELNKFLERMYVDEGIKKENIKPEQIEKALRNEYFDITWASVEVKGTKMVVHIRENDGEVVVKEEVDNEVTGDIICSKDAYVESIITRTGTPKVKSGAAVKKGDVLILGKYELLGDDLSVILEQNVRADGDVIGKVIYNVDETIDRSYVMKRYTGREYAVNKGKWQDKAIDFSIRFGRDKYEKFDVYIHYSQLLIGDSFYLPIYTEKQVIREYILSEEMYTEDEVKALGERKLMYILKKIEENTIQILDNNVKIEIGEEKCRIYGQITALENIGSFGGTYE